MQHCLPFQETNHGLDPPSSKYQTIDYDHLSIQSKMQIMRRGGLHSIIQFEQININFTRLYGDISHLLQLTLCDSMKDFGGGEENSEVSEQ